MILHPVKSSSIDAVGYDPQKRALRIRFKSSSKIYEYAQVSPKEHEALISAQSIGGHASKHIIPKKRTARV